ncbi:hypothetical protein VTI28DRAFT_7880 [Corynascus sepedonium]
MKDVTNPVDSVGKYKIALAPTTRICLDLRFQYICELVLRREPVGVVFGEYSLTDGDDLLEQHDSVFDLAVGFVGYCELVLRREP